jgi:hypothetical protein
LGQTLDKSPDVASNEDSAADGQASLGDNHQWLLAAPPTPVASSSSLIQGLIGVIGA